MKTKKEIAWFYGSIAAASILLIIYGHFFYSNVNYAFDAHYYIELADSFTAGGHFSFLNFPESIRGYALPLVYFLAKTIGSFFHIGQNGSILILQSICLVLASAFLFPFFVSKEYKVKYDLRYLIVVILFFIWWKDLICWALSDLWAVYFCLAGGFLLEKAFRIQNCAWKKRVLSFGAGACLYLAYNTRTIYLFADAAIFFILLFQNRKKERITGIETGSILIGLLAGLFFTAVPQMRINHYYLGTFSPKVFTSVGYKGGLFLKQLQWGVEMQHYDTWVGSLEIFPSNAMYYAYEEVKQILEQFGEISSYGDYIRLWLSYPLDMFGIWFKHLINGLCLSYGQVYIDTFQSRQIYIILNYMVLYLASVIGIYDLKIKKHTMIKLTWMATLITCFFISFGAVESRFFIPVFLIMYIMIAWADWKQIVKWMKDYWMIFGLTFIIGLGICCAVWSNTFVATEIPVFMK